MIYLFVHQNFPAQYRHVARYLADQPGNSVYFITQPNTNWMRGVTKVIYEQDIPANLNCHPFTVDFDLAVRNGLAVAAACKGLRNQGVRPDVIVGHNGWGETLFIKEVFPESPLLAYFEFFYHHVNADVGFDPEFPGDVSDPFRLRTRNLVNYLSFDSCDWGNTPTEWQRSTYPPEMRPRISIMHEGIDTEIVRPDEGAWVKLSRAGVTLNCKDEVITFVTRNMEPYRGFHIFMRALPMILQRRPSAHVLIVGGDGVSYGAPAPAGTTYRDIMLREVGSQLDFNRVHFLGQIPYERYLNVLQVSSAHIYLTYPFVLSWSFIEAMAAGCAVIGSDTAPVAEVLRDGENGLLVDFFSPEEIADRVDQILDDPDRRADLRTAARQTAIADFDLKTKALPRWLSVLDDMAHLRRPPTFAPARTPA